MIRLASLAAIAFLGLSFSVSPRTANAGTFSEFEGVYRGKGSVTLSSDFVTGTTFTAPARVFVKVPEDGDSAEVSLRGSFLAFETKFPMFADVTFKDGRYLVDNYIFRVEYVGSLPARGTYRGGGRNVSFKAISGPSTRTPVSGSMRVRTKGRRQIIEYTQNVTIPDGSFIFHFEATRPLRPDER